MAYHHHHFICSKTKDAAMQTKDMDVEQDTTLRKLFEKKEYGGTSQLQNNAYIQTSLRSHWIFLCHRNDIDDGNMGRRTRDTNRFLTTKYWLLWSSAAIGNVSKGHVSIWAPTGIDQPIKLTHSLWLNCKWVQDQFLFKKQVGVGLTRAERCALLFTSDCVMYAFWPFMAIQGHRL